MTIQPDKSAFIPQLLEWSPEALKQVSAELEGSRGGVTPSLQLIGNYRSHDP